MACEFCELMEKGENKVYEDEKVVAMLSTRPASIGHILVMPKEHYPIIEQVPDYIIAHLFQITNKISTAIFEAIRVQGTNIIVTNGVAAGQRYNHFIVNIIPRAPDDGLSFQWKSKQLSEEEMSTVELQVKEKTKNIGGFEKEPEKPVEMDREAKVISESKENENYLLKQLRRIP